MDVTLQAGIRLATYPGGQPEFICPVHSQPMSRQPSREHEYRCTRNNCSKTLSFREVQNIAQWLRGYI